MKTLNTKRGFTLMIAALVASLMAALGIAMFSIAQKELRLSSTTRDSQFAFYAADAGAECALYLHYAYDAFATSTIFGDVPEELELEVCDTQALLEIDDAEAAGLGGTSVTRFKYNLQGVNSSGSPVPYCVSVQVTKSTSFPHTQIKSLGYNVSCDSRATSPRVLERAVNLNL